MPIDFGNGLAYLAATILFIFGLKMMGRVRSARRGNALASLAMLVAVVATLDATIGISWGIVLTGLVVGGAIGGWMARTVAMTGMPELVALFNGLGGAASLLVALSVFWDEYLGLDTSGLAEVGGEGPTAASHFGLEWAISVLLSVLIGALTVTGSLVAVGKLSGKLPGQPILLPMRHVLNLGVLAAVVVLAGLACFGATGGASAALMIILAIVAGVLGVLLVIPIGGADMPVVVSLLNSYSGLAASMTGFVIQNPLLIAAGALVGAAGLILTGLMCKAMNRSLMNVLVGGFGDTGGAGDQSDYENVKATGPEEAAMILEGAASVIFVPGYGMAVAQAQHAVKELADALEKNGAKVSYAIHPVAGRMPGHMNVLLAEADVNYEQLFELDKINGEFKNTDVAVIIGANDVVNPAANEDPESPIAGMPILNAYESHTVLMIKRSLSPGYAGIKNPLFERDNCLMCFGDGKQFLVDVIAEFKS